MAIQIKRVVGKNFEKIRKKLGLAQDELAYETKTSQHTVSHIENGAENFKIDTLDTYLKYFGIPPFYLFLPEDELQSAEIYNNEVLVKTIIMSLYKYFLTVKYIFDPDFSEWKNTYGIKLKAERNVLIEDISTDKDFVLSLVEMCNAYQIPTEHFPDIIRDAMLKEEMNRMEEFAEH